MNLRAVHIRECLDKRISVILVLSYVVVLACHDCFVVTLCMNICLRMISCGNREFESKISAGACKTFADIIGAIVSRKIFWNVIRNYSMF